MPPRSDRDTLFQILDYAREARELTSGQSFDEIIQDRVLVLAITRLLEIIGEAAGRVSVDIQRKHPEIPWPQLVGLRNRLIHGYDAVDMEIVWTIIQSDLPPLIDATSRILDSEFGDDDSSTPG